jgi:hypothetical protein
MFANWSAVLVSWLPFLALLMVWLYLRRTGMNKFDMNKYYEEIQRMNALLDRIAVALEKRAGTSA